MHLVTTFCLSSWFQTASREGHILGFSIKETNCSKSTQQAEPALQCDFLDDWHAVSKVLEQELIEWAAPERSSHSISKCFL